MLGYQSLEEGGVSKEESTLHCHQSRREGVDERARRKLLIAAGLCLVFMIAEIVGGVLSNSLAIATDAAHMLTDFASFLISLLAIWLAGKPKSQKMSFGWHRAEVIGATISVLMIWLVTGVIVYMAIHRVMNQEFMIEPKAMLITSGLGVLVNIVMGATLHQHGHSHGGGSNHGHSHDVEKGLKPEKHSENINVSAAFIHVLGDFIQSVGVFLAAIVIFFKPDWNLIDPICTFVFSLLVLATTISILRKTLSVLLEATPSNINFDLVKNTFLGVKGIHQIHNLRIWGLTTDKNALTAHLAVKEGFSQQEVLQEATRQVRSLYDFYEMTLQVETFVDEMQSCEGCKTPDK